MSMTYRQLLRNLETMPESELDTMIRVNHFDNGIERPMVVYVAEFGYNEDSQFVLKSDEAVFQSFCNQDRT